MEILTSFVKRVTVLCAIFCNLRSKRRLVAPLVFQRKNVVIDVPQMNFVRDARIIFLKLLEVSRGDGKRRVCSLGTRPALDFIA